MSAAYWRRAMNTGMAATARPQPLRVATAPADRTASTWFDAVRRAVALRHVVIVVALLVYPFVATPFFTFQIAAQSLALGLIALSLTWLGGYGGMLSLAQLTVAGIAGYSVAILGTSATALSLGWPWWVVIPFAIAIAVVAATLIGWLSARTEGIYTIMITLAMGVAFYYLALQNYTIFNGFQGFQKVYPPIVFGVDWRAPVPFYFLTLALSMAGYFWVKWLVKTPFGIALQGVRDNPRRMAALGFNVTAHRVAAYSVAGVIAAVGGVQLVWYNGLITPNALSTGPLINILIIAVLGGMKHPIGAFLGAVVFVLLQTFAIDVIDRERFNLVIGVVFLLIVLFSPDGLLGLWAKLRAHIGRRQSITTTTRRQA